MALSIRFAFTASHLKGKNMADINSASITIEINAELERICLESKEIIEGFHKLLGVSSSTEALSKISVLMREEEELTAPVFDFVRSIIQGKFHGHGFEHSEEPCNCNELAAADFLQKFQDMTQHT